MAAESFRLADAHRLAQARLGGETVRLMERLSPMLDPADVDGTAGRWLAATVPVTQAQANRSAALAADYLTTARRLDVGDDPRFSPVRASVNPERIATSLWFTGPARARKLTAEGAGLATVRRTVLTTSSRSAMRLTLAGGRDTIVDTLAADPRPAGWARVTSGKPCAFCAMLASRGPVYRGEDAASFEAHDGCACSAMAVWNRNDGWTPQARQYHELWHETTGDESGADKFNAFRRAIEGGPADLAAAA